MSKDEMEKDIQENLVQEISVEKTEERSEPSRLGKKWLLVPGIILGVGLLLGLIMLIPAKKVLADVNILQISGKELVNGFKEKDLVRAKLANEQLKNDLQKLTSDFNFFRWLGFVPVVRNYYQDSEHVFKSAQAGLEAVDLVIAGIEPYADIIGFVGDKEGEGTTAEDRINFIVNTIDKIQPQMEGINEKIELIKQELDQIDVGRYPEEIRGKKVRSSIRTTIEFVDQAHFLLKDGQPVIKQASWLLGEDKPRKFLVLFQNDGELRPTGGFITAYAILEVFKGKITPLVSEDIYSLDARFGKKIPAPEPIKNYLPKVFYWNLRDMNLSPDFSVSMADFTQNFNQVPAVPQIDGVVAVDTEVLARLLEVLGPIGVSGWGNFSAEEDARCSGCPQVVYELERLITKPVSEVRTARKAVLGPLMHSILQNAMQSPKDKMAAIFNVGLSSVLEKHLLFYFFDEEIQEAFESFNMAGRIKEYEGDYFHLNDCNFAGAKSNMFIKQEVEQKIEISGDGEVTKEVIITYRNPAPASNCNLEAGQLCLNGLYRDWVRLYVPKGSILLDSSGSEVDVKTSEDLGKTVFEAFYGDEYPLRPLGSTKLIFKYKLPFKVEKGASYNLLIQKQPGTDEHQYTIELGGQLEEFELKTDKEVRFSL